MRAKTAIILVVAIGLGWIIYSGIQRSRDTQIGNDLARRIDRSQPDRSDSDEPVTLRANMIRLADDLTAEAEADGTWLIRHPGQPAQVALPFRPPRQGGQMKEKSIKPRTAEDESLYSNPGFVGADACRECHLEKHEGFVHTSHYRTSGVAQADTLPGSLSPPENHLPVPESDLQFAVHAKDGRPFQKIDFGEWELDVPMDAFTGSNKLGQSYLYWLGDALYQNHVSYTASFDEWIPSPGFPEDGGFFTREVTVRCLECHTTFIERVAPPNHFDRQSAIWGISCERCHGPGKQHVEYHQNNPELREAKFITHPQNLTREQQLDICAQCHSGLYVARTPPFAFRPGDRLADHRKPRPENASKAGSVHTSNQLARLSQSPCFKGSEMTCATCHDPHQLQRGDHRQFSARCQDCHQPDQCGMHDQLGERLAANCIDCHMPTGEVQQMELDTAAGRFSPPMIDHLIRIDREATERFLESEPAAER